MAKSHVVQYFLEVENQYLEMVENVSELKELAAEGRISNDAYQAAIADIELLKANYERIGYIMFLLNKPQRKNKKPDKTTLGWYNALKYASKEAIIDENRDALAKLKELIREGKLGNE